MLRSRRKPFSIHSIDVQLKRRVYFCTCTELSLSSSNGEIHPPNNIYWKYLFYVSLLSITLLTHFLTYYTFIFLVRKTFLHFALFPMTLPSNNDKQSNTNSTIYNFFNLIHQITLQTPINNNELTIFFNSSTKLVLSCSFAIWKQ